jgi:ABC-type nitrate/sulfonate/bicarbonate transport system permease component
MRKLYGVIAGALIGTLLGFLADQTLTSYVLQHSEDAITIIFTNALSAFLLFPLFIVLFGFLGYRLIKRKPQHLH